MQKSAIEFKVPTKSSVQESTSASVTDVNIKPQSTSSFNIMGGFKFSKKRRHPSQQESENNSTYSQSE